MKKQRKMNRSGLRRIFNRFAPHLEPHKRTLMMAGFCTLGTTMMELLRPWPLKFVFDELLAPPNSSSLWLKSLPIIHGDNDLLLGAISLSILLIAILTGIFGFGQAYLTSSVGQKVVAAIRHQVYNHIQRLSHSFHDENCSGDLLSRLISDIRMMRELLVTSILYICDRSLVIIGMLAIMLWMDWQLTLVALAILPVLWLTTVKFSRNLKNATRRQRRKESKVVTALTERLSTISVIQAFAREAHEEAQFARQNEKSTQAGLVTTRLEAHMNRLVQVLLALGTTGILWFGVSKVQTGQLTPGDLLVFMAYVTGLYKPVRKLSALTSRMAKATVCGERIVSILETEPEIKDTPNAIEAPSVCSDIVFENVDFSYPNGHSVLSGANLNIRAGETVALVGESGSGKSTLLKLLLRFYDPQNGRVLIDGCDIRTYTLESLRGQIAVVLQESVLFNASVSQNISYGKLDATMAEIIASAKAANAHQFIETLPNGYDTIVGERGASLSGGQRQRIAIARAIIRHSSVVILDEPTSGLDHENKAEIEQALTRLTANSTCFTITHSLATAKSADRILRVKGGCIVEMPAESQNHEATQNSMVIN